MLNVFLFMPVAVMGIRPMAVDMVQFLMNVLVGMRLRERSIMGVEVVPIPVRMDMGVDQSLVTVRMFVSFTGD